EQAREGVLPVAGGDSIVVDEPQYGMVAVGEVDPGRMLSIDRARPGDDLVLTKPLGSGIVATAVKAGACPGEVLAEAVRTMARLNRAATGAALAAGASAATDVTGYGLTGHLGNMVRASGVSASIDAARVPLLPGVRALAEAGHVPGGTRRNQTDSADTVIYEGAIDEITRILLADAQTSGGLLIACPPDRTPALLDELDERREVGHLVGEVMDGADGRIVIL
ncbi:MAG: selenide, water dikinase SelD, partial [Gemmatimonadetes bacterium]|nr:selenide, water dikinase SelD [Gemmatimonadota bacterium]